jgi:Xaa-Pro aminopeptidase
MDFRQRCKQLASMLAPNKLDALVVTSAPNVRYLSGFTGDNGALLVSAGSTTLFTDPRYEIQAAGETGCKVIVARGPLLERLMAEARRKRLRRLGFERDRISYREFQTLDENRAPGARLDPVVGAVEQLRCLKDPGEVALIRHSMQIAVRAFEQAAGCVRSGMTEADLAAELDHRMRTGGAEASSFETIVAAGRRSALPHARPSRAPIKEGQLVLIDMGALADGYASDMTRMLHLGEPSRKVRQMYAAVLEAQMAAIEAVRPGVPAATVDRVARRTLRRYGFDKLFVHSTGHGVGLEIHEGPRLGRTSQDTLETGMVVTIEPGVYVAGFGGIRIEDTVVVTSNGAEVLTQLSKQLRIL